MQIDKPNSSGGFVYNVLRPTEYSGVAGDGRIYALAITGTTSVSDSGIQLYLVNGRPSVDAENGGFKDPYLVGANSTIDVFSTQPGAHTMNHIRTFANAQIATPNNVALTNDGGFYFTNDHGKYKTGWVSRVTFTVQLLRTQVNHQSYRGLTFPRY